MLVNCIVCEKTVEGTSCWTVIDAKSHKRWYECKDQCKLKSKGKPILDPIRIPEVKQEELEDPEALEKEEETAEPQAYRPKKPLLSRVLSFFGFQTFQYKRIKQD